MAGVENANYVGQLNAVNPTAADFISQGDDHLRLLKATLLATFPGFSRPIDGALFRWKNDPLAITVYAKFMEEDGRLGVIEDFISPANAAGAILRANNNLSDVQDPAIARANLGVTAVTDVLLQANNLGDVQDAALARANLGVPEAGTLLEKVQNLADLPDKALARSNLEAAASTDVLQKASNLSDVPNKAAARANLDVMSTSAVADAIAAAQWGGMPYATAITLGGIKLGDGLAYNGVTDRVDTVIQEAPEDGKQYARKDGDWEEISDYIGSLSVTVGAGGTFATWADCYAMVSAMRGGDLTILGQAGVPLDIVGDVRFPSWRSVVLGNIVANYTFRLSGDYKVSVASVVGSLGGLSKLENVLATGGYFADVRVTGLRPPPNSSSTVTITGNAGKNFYIANAVGNLYISDYNAGTVVVENSHIYQLGGRGNMTVAGAVYAESIVRSATGYLSSLIQVRNGILNADTVNCASGGVGTVFDIDCAVVNAPSISGTYTSASNLIPNVSGYGGLYLGSPTIKTYSKKTDALTSSSGVITVDCADGLDKRTITLSENVTSWSFTNRPTGTDYIVKIVAVTQDASTARTCVSPATKTAGSAWTVSSTLSSEEWLELWIGASDVYLRASGTMV